MRRTAELIARQPCTTRAVDALASPLGSEPTRALRQDCKKQAWVATRGRGGRGGDDARSLERSMPPLDHARVRCLRCQLNINRATPSPSPSGLAGFLPLLPGETLPEASAAHPSAEPALPGSSVRTSSLRCCCRFSTDASGGSFSSMDERSAITRASVRVGPASESELGERRAKSMSSEGRFSESSGTTCPHRPRRCLDDDSCTGHSGRSARWQVFSIVDEAVLLGDAGGEILSVRTPKARNRVLASRIGAFISVRAGRGSGMPNSWARPAALD